MVGWPTFLVLGAARSGTTSLHEYLAQHPAVGLPRLKETHFFAAGDPRRRDASGRDPWLAGQITDPAAYRALFPARATTAVGEVCPSYLLSSVAAPRIRALAPDARLIVVLRDPAARAHSHFHYEHAFRGDRAERFATAVALDVARFGRRPDGPAYLAAGLYAPLLERYRVRFPSDQLLLYLFDDLVADAAAFMARLFEDIGVDPRVAVDVSRRHNAGRWPRGAVARSALSPHGALYRLLRAATPRRLRPRLAAVLRRRTPASAPPALDPTTRRQLVAFYEPDVRWLEARLGRELGDWR